MLQGGVLWCFGASATGLLNHVLLVCVPFLCISRRPASCTRRVGSSSMSLCFCVLQKTVGSCRLRTHVWLRGCVSTSCADTVVWQGTTFEIGSYQTRRRRLHRPSPVFMLWPLQVKLSSFVHCTIGKRCFSTKIGVGLAGFRCATRMVASRSGLLFDMRKCIALCFLCNVNPRLVHPLTPP